MKKAILSGIAILSLLTIGLAIFQTSCSTDKCKNVTCNNNGTCTSGTCTCPTGYSGSDCSLKWVTKYVANYKGVDQCGSDTTHYKWNGSIISSSTDASKFYIVNLGGFGSSAQFSCTLTDSLHFNIDAQTQNGYKINSGTGSLSTTGTSISATFSVTDPSSATCTETSSMTKQ